MRRLLIVLIVLGVLVGGATVAGYFGLQYMKAKSVPHYTTAEVTTGKIETVVNSTGTIKPVLSVSVGSFVSGPIKDILVDFNDVVKKGQLLARIDPFLLQSTLDHENASLTTQKADYDRITAQLEQAVKSEARAVNLRKTNKDYLSDQDMDQLHYARVVLEAQQKLSRASIAGAEANVKFAMKNLEYTEIKSPVDGIVIDRKVDPGQTVASSFQTPEMFIIGLDMDKHLYVFASVDEADIVQILTAQEKGRPVQFTVDSCPEDVFNGKIFQVRQNATTTQNVVTYPVIVEVPNPNLKKLRMGATANVSFQIDVRENATRIPAAALRFVPSEAIIRPEDKKYVNLKPKKDPKESEEKLSAERRAEQGKARSKRVVWVQGEGNKVIAIPITIGLMDGQYAELVSGDVKPGQTLVTGLEGDDRARR